MPAGISEGERWNRQRLGRQQCAGSIGFLRFKGDLW
jgi:hypothetical protein